MVEPNPFEPPGDKPPIDAQLSDRELLRLPASARAGEAIGDRYWWPIVVLLGVVIIVAPLLVGWASFWILLFGIILTVGSLIAWVKEKG